MMETGKMEKGNGPIRQAIDAIDVRLQELNEKLVHLEQVLAPAMHSMPTPEEENKCQAKPGESELSCRLWAAEGRINCQNQDIARLIDSLEV